MLFSSRFCISKKLFCISKHALPWHLPSLRATHNTGSEEVNIRKSWKEKRKVCLLYLNSPGKSHLLLFPLIKLQLQKEKENKKRRWSGSRRQKKTVRHSQRRSDTEMEAEASSGGWQALLSAESDMAVGDRWQNQKVMSLLTGSACAPLISLVPPRHRRAHLCSSRCLSVSAKLADRMAGWQTERQATGTVWSGTGASGAWGMPQQNPPSLPFHHVTAFSSFPSICLALFITLNLCNCLCSFLAASAAPGVCLSDCCCFVYTVRSL